MYAKEIYATILSAVAQSFLSLRANEEDKSSLTRPSAPTESTIKSVVALRECGVNALSLIDRESGCN